MQPDVSAPNPLRKLERRQQEKDAAANHVQQRRTRAGRKPVVDLSQHLSAFGRKGIVPVQYLEDPLAQGINASGEIGDEQAAPCARPHADARIPPKAYRPRTARASIFSAMQGALSAFRALDDGRHRAEFYRMWRVGHSAAFTHPKSLETMGPRESPGTEDARSWLLAGTKRGRGIAELVRTGGSRFDEFERAILMLGEESGSLDGALGSLADFFTKKHQLMLWVKKQMAYPLFTGVAACFIAPLPLLFFGNATAYFVGAGASAGLLLAGSGAIVTAVAASYGRKPPMARARRARALATAVQAGLALPRAVRLAAEASANPDIQAFVLTQSEQQLSTRAIEKSLEGCPHLTPEFFAMLETAERTGDFATLTRLAELYEDGFR